MSVSLGKRKRFQTNPKSSKSHKNTSPALTNDDEDNVRDLLRKHFELSFKPLAAEKTAKSDDYEDTNIQEDEEEDDWNGFSEEDTGAIQVVELANSSKNTTPTDRQDLKAFMVCEIL